MMLDHEDAQAITALTVAGDVLAAAEPGQGKTSTGVSLQSSNTNLGVGTANMRVYSGCL